MGFRVIHHEGDKDLLMKKIQEIAGQLKNDEYKDNFEEGEWEDAVDSVISGDFSDLEMTSLVLHIAINTAFPPISEDCYIQGYLDLAHKTSGKLAKTLEIFVEGRNFFTGKMGFGSGGEITCGYLTSDEVKEFLALLKAYTPDNSASGEKEFVDLLIEDFSMLAQKNSGDLFIMS